jgi:large repetitive protein
MEAIMKRVIFFISLLFFAGLMFILAGCSNKSPTAQAGSVSTQEDTPVAITLSGGDPEGDPLTWHIDSKPANGTLSGTEPNLVYTPKPNFNGVDSFSFVVSDGKNTSKPAKVSILVKAVNDLPVAVDDFVTIAEDSPIAMIDVLANDTDPDKDTLVVLAVRQPANGQVTINTDNRLTYKPAKDFNGDDSFTYTISDGNGGTAIGRVNIKVTPVNDAPQITSKPITAGRVWGAYSYPVKAEDPDKGDILTYSLTSAPEGMTIDTASGLIKFMPTSEQSGNFNVTVKVTDSANVSATQSFTLAVASLSAPLEETLHIEDSFIIPKPESSPTSAAVKSSLATSDGNVITIPAGSYLCLNFSDITIPQGAKIASIVLYVEHYEDDNFPADRLTWSIGTGWPDKPAVYDTMNAPVRTGRKSKTQEMWDITSLCNTPEKINSLQLNLQNKTSGGYKSSVDNVYAVVKWY